MADIKIQHGYADILNNGGTITLGSTVSSTSSAFAINTNNRRMNGGRSNLNAGNLEVDDMSGGLYLSNSSTVQFDRISTSQANEMRFFYEVWEYTGSVSGPNEFIVRGTYQLTLTGESTTQAVSNITNINDCVPYITGILSSSGNDDADSATAIAWMSSTGTLNVKRGSGSNNTVQVYVTVVEYTGSNWSVKHGRQEGSGTDTGTVTLVDAADGTTAGGGNVSDWENALIIHQYKANALNGVDDAISDTSAVLVPGSSTTEVDWAFHSNHVDSATAGQREEFMVHVLCHSFMKVNRKKDTQSLAGTMKVAVPINFFKDMSTSSVEVSRYSSGTGTAYGRGWVNAMVNSLDIVELWVHRSGNTIRTEVQQVDLSNVTNIAITDQGDEQLDVGDSAETATGFGFGTTQGTGKLELASSPVYSSATKVLQTINSWSDSSINFDPIFTSLPNGYLYLFVTNDSGDVSPGFRVNYGEIEYINFLKSLNPDIYHTFNNTYIDEMGVADANSLNTTGVVGFEATQITRGTSYSFRVEDNASRIKMVDTNFTNKVSRYERTVGGWIQLDRVHLTPSGIYEEGGGVNNMYFVVGFGNIILGNLADSSGNPDYKIQGFSDFKLSVDRPYHVILKLKVSTSAGANDGRFHMFIDGKEVNKYAGLETVPNMIKDTEFSSHSGDWSYGKPDTNLDTGGTDINYPGAPYTLISNFGTWSDLGAGALTDTEIFELFIRGAKQTSTISSDTQANMQTSIDSLEGTSYFDKPLPIKIYPCGDESNPTFNLRNVTFDKRCSSQVVWMGSGNLTIIAWDGAKIDPNECHSLSSGSITITYPNKATISGVKDGAKIAIYEHTSGNLLDSINSSVGDFLVETLESSVDIFIIADGWKIIQLYDVPISTESVIPIVQEKDYSYDNPA